ncbi:MAG: hypothetical protein QNJ88_14675 [Acidimicrobiia bacterium]|nr:hypothetical protein [Acidimicrobiia bacterium]
MDEPSSRPTAQPWAQHAPSQEAAGHTPQPLSNMQPSSVGRAVRSGLIFGLVVAGVLVVVVVVLAILIANSDGFGCIGSCPGN